MARHLPCQGR